MVMIQTACGEMEREPDIVGSMSICVVSEGQVENRARFFANIPAHYEIHNLGA